MEVKTNSVTSDVQIIIDDLDLQCIDWREAKSQYCEERRSEYEDDDGYLVTTGPSVEDADKYF